MILWPISLTVLRLALGPLVVLCALHGFSRTIFTPLLLIGILSDIFDGVLARRFGVSRPWLRRFDSITDVVFYLFVLWATWIVARPVITAVLLPLGLLLVSEAACILVSLIRFGVFPATHCYSAKFYGLVLFFAVLAVLSFGAGSWTCYALTAVGLVANAEVLAILLLARRPPVDIGTVFRFNRDAA